MGVTSSGETNPFLFVTHTQFGERPTGTSTATPWVAGGVTTIEGDQITTGSISATKITANTITADRMAVAGGWTWADAYFKKDTGTEATSSGMAPSDWPFYAGAQYANRATAPFRISNAGALTATSATITGTINATAGYFGNASTDVAIDSDGIVVGSSGRISAGGGAVEMNSGGFNIASGTGTANMYKFTGSLGMGVHNNGDSLSLYAGAGLLVAPNNGSATLAWVGSKLYTTSGTPDIGSTSARWNDLWLENDIHHFGDYYWDSPPTTTAADLPIVWSSSIKALYQKTDGTTVNSCTTVNTESGIVTACSDPITPQIAALEARIAQLEAQMALLLEEARKR
jgi:hypothetical protein